MTQIVDQPPPVGNDRPAIQDLVLADIAERKRLGIERYGRALQPHNGRDALVDAYQEVLDLAMYVRQEIEERSDAAAEGAAAEREKIVGFLRHRARQLEEEGDVNARDAVGEVADAIERGAHHDTWPAPPPSDDMIDPVDGSSLLDGDPASVLDEYDDEDDDEDPDRKSVV